MTEQPPPDSKEAMKLALMIPLSYPTDRRVQMLAAAIDALCERRSQNRDAEADRLRKDVELLAEERAQAVEALESAERVCEQRVSAAVLGEHDRAIERCAQWHELQAEHMTEGDESKWHRQMAVAFRWCLKGATAERPAPPQQPARALGIPIIADSSLPPGTAEMRSGNRVVRITNLDSSVPSALAGEQPECGAVLRSERARLGVAQNDLAALLRISPQYLCDIELGRRSFSEDRIDSLPEAMQGPVARALIAEHETAITRLCRLASTGGQPDCDALVAALDDLVHEYIALAIQTKQPIEYRLNPALVAAGKLVEEARDAGGLSSTETEEDSGKGSV